MDIGELNTRVTVNSYSITQNETTGRVESSLTDSWTRWMKVEQTANSRALESLAISFKEAYTITKRYERDRPTLNNYTLTLVDKTLTIGNIVRKNIGKIWFEELNAYTTQ